ncbi:MAG: DUF5301 domain-containing protein [Romboutsia sp.]|uniref:DUF5301 domain-containing protein n=1 Tax=Romboutsia sp. TaxID=1965302 RepID=UPI003F33F4D5
MNVSKKISALMLIFYLSLSFVGCDGFEITFSDESDLESIVLSEYSEGKNNRITITDTEEIKNILNSIKSNSKKTNEDSVGEIPINTEQYIILELLYSTDEGKVAEMNYMYKRKDRYYIERPYVGIWNITEESYDDIDILIN